MCGQGEGEGCWQLGDPRNKGHMHRTGFVKDTAHDPTSLYFAKFHRKVTLIESLKQTKGTPSFTQQVMKLQSSW